MKKLLKSYLVLALLSVNAFAFINEQGVINGLLQVDISAKYGHYSSFYSDGETGDIKSSMQFDLYPVIRLRPVQGFEFSLGLPLREDDDMKEATGIWGPILGIKYGHQNSAGFFDIILPYGAKDILGLNKEPQPVLILGGTSVYGSESFAVRLHTYYWWDFNDYSADQFFFLVRPEFTLAGFRFGLGFPIEFYFGSDYTWISSAPGVVRASGHSANESLGYSGAISIAPSVLVPIGMFEVEPTFSIPIAKFSNSPANIMYGFTIGCTVRINLFQNKN